jgi:predicted RND superfamily exporter protein
LFGDKLKYLAISAVSTQKPFQPRVVMKKVFDQWESLIATTNALSGTGINNAFQTALEAWPSMIVEENLIRGAAQGILIAVIFAFIILTIATLNIYIALLAILSIGGILASVLGLIGQIGWQFGLIESISLVIIVGFSVDYTVHLGSHYTHSVFKDKFSRTQESLGEMGISVVGGAITTFGSAIFLMPCVILFFNKMAILMFATISFSFLFSLVFFVAMTHSCGPEGERGNIAPYIEKAKNMCKSLCSKKGEKLQG